MTILVTGFGEYKNLGYNPSKKVAERLDGEEIAGHEVKTQILPAEFGEASARIREILETEEPELLVSTGVSKRKVINVERIGINVRESEEEGVSTERISREGVDGVFSTLPVEKIVEGLLEEDIPARISNTAGTRMCNEVLYSALTYTEERELGAKIGFLHLPLTPELQAREIDSGGVEKRRDIPGSLPLELQVEAVRKAVKISLDE